MAASGGARKPAARRPAAKKKPAAKKPAARKPAAKKLKPLRALTRKQWGAVGPKAFGRFDEVGGTDRAAALAFWNSPEYAEAKKLREGLADCSILLVGD